MQKGFMLIELIVLVLIVGMLAVIAVPQYIKTVEKAKWPRPPS
jgi:Tfp pilus assembly protein PilE